MRAVGEMPEWPNGTDSKSVVLATVPRVQIPISPPLFEKPQKSRFWGFFVSGVWKGIRIGTLTPPRAFLRPAEL
jgi:hypothetical protein